MNLQKASLMKRSYQICHISAGKRNEHLFVSCIYSIIYIRETITVDGLLLDLKEGGDADVHNINRAYSFFNICYCTHCLVKRQALILL